MSAHFRFFDTCLDIHAAASGSGREVLAWLVRTHGRFRQGAQQSFPAPGCRRMALYMAQHAWDAVTVAVDDGQPWTLPLISAQHLGGLVVRMALARVRSHFLVHAGAVSNGEQGMLLAGPSGAGKTTLVLELIRRGLAFLSDETGALAGGWVHPFPRAAHVRTWGPRPGTNGGPPGPTGAESFWVDVEAAGWGQVGDAVPLGVVVLLSRPASPAVARSITVLCTRTGPGLARAVQALASVEEAWFDDRWPFPAITYRARNFVEAFEDIQAVCRGRGVAVVDVAEASAQPAFGPEAHLERLSHTGAALELLPHLQNGLRSGGFRDAHQARPVQLFTALVRQIREADCYRLRVGPLTTTADLVCDIFGAAPC